MKYSARIKKIWSHGHQFKDLWVYGISGKHHRSRFQALRDWAKHKAKLAAHPARFIKARRAYNKWLKDHPKPHPASVWPDTMHVEELFNNDNGLHNHVHIASPDRDALIALGIIAIKEYGGAGMVREFPPFDPVECVHTGVSWHYRDSSNPYTYRYCANRGDGCASDNGFPRRDEFGYEVKRRYGASRCDF